MFDSIEIVKDESLWSGPNGAVCCSDHKGRDGWSRMSAMERAMWLETCKALNRVMTRQNASNGCEVCK